MAGKRIVRASILLVVSALLLLFLAPGTGVKATNWDTTYTVILSDNAPGANADQTTIYNLTQLDNNFATILSSTGSPEAQIALDSEIAEGSDVGFITNQTTLSIFNGPCVTPVVVDIPFMEGTTDTLDTVPWVGTGDNLVQDNDNDMNEDGTPAPAFDGDCIDGVDNDGDGVSEDGAGAGSCTDGIDNGGDTLKDAGDPDCLADGYDPDCNNEAKDTNGIPTYADHYPEFLNDMYDGDGAGPLYPCRARARYVGHQVVVADAPATILQFVIFNPEALRKCGYPGVAGTLGDTYGFIDFVVLDNPIQAVAPSTITDFCGPLTSQPTLYGLSKGQWQVMPGPEPYEVDAAGQCNDGLDQDGDTIADDGCLYKPDPCDLADWNEDGTPAVPPGHGNCADGIDNDGDTLIDGADPDPECKAKADNDGDTAIDEDCDYVRNQNPPSHTGIFGTGTHIVRTYSMSQRDVDNDGVSNNLDTCPYLPNVGDSDADGIDDACDPNPLVPSAGAPAACTATSGIPDEDQDCFPNRQDNCPLVRNGDPYDPVPSGWDQSDTDTPPGAAPADLGPGTDAIGDACDASPNTADGHYHVALAIAYSCIPDNFGADDTDNNGDADNDDDGVCDSTEDLLGSDKNNAASTPEHLAIDLAIATDTPGEAPGTCTDYTVYDHPDAGPIDNDADTLANSLDPDCYYDPTRSEDGAGANTCSDGIDNGGEGKTDGDDRDCLDMPTETDDDGVPDVVDNCPLQQNQEQVDSDSDEGIDNDADTVSNEDREEDKPPGVPGDDNDGDTVADEDPGGDECDPDDDNDGFSDFVENQIGTDPKDNCADHPNDNAWPLDFDNDQDADIVDVLKFKPVILKPKEPGGARFDFDADCDIDIVDVLKFKPYILTHCRKTISFTLPATATEPVNDIHIEFFAEITYVEPTKVTDDQGGTWICERVPPLCANAVDDDGDTLVNDGCRPLFGAGEPDPANPCPPGSTPQCGTAAACANSVDDDGDTKVNDGCPAGGPDADGDTHPDSEDRYTGGLSYVEKAPDGSIPWYRTYVYGSPSYKLNCRRDTDYMTPGGTLEIELKGKRPPEVRCYDWTTDTPEPCTVVNSSSKPCSFHVDLLPADNLYVEFGKDLDGDTISDQPGVSWCDNVSMPDPDASEDGAGAGTCKDGIDNGGDTLKDLADPDCTKKIWSVYFPHAVAGVDILMDTDGDTIPDLVLFPTDIVRGDWARPGPWTLQCWAWSGTGLDEAGVGGPADCNDGLDNDADTYIDSADPDCWTEPPHGECKYNPALEEDLAGANTCGDGIDNGGDTVADLADPDCFNP